MLKIKDNADLKELEKFGIKKYNEYAGILIYFPKGNSGHCRYFSKININEKTREIEFSLENMSMWCNSLEELEDDFKNIQYSYNDFKRLVDDLIKDNLVEKIGDDK